MACTKKLDERTNGWTNEGKIICLFNFIRNWGHNQVIYSSLPIYSSSFKAPASKVFKYFADKLDERTNGRTNEGKIICLFNFIRNWGHNQVIYSSLPIYSSSFKAPASTVFKYFADKRNMPKFTKGHYLRNIFQNLHKS